MGTSGGNGRVLNSTVDDNVFLYYVDHGAPGIIEFPNDEVMHATRFQKILMTMHHRKLFKHLLVYIEACESGSMLEGIPSDVNIYGVTAVGPEVPSLGTYCGHQAAVNGTLLNTCLGDLFSVMWMDFLEDDDGNSTLQQFFDSVYDESSTYAALHYGSELNQQYGDLSLTRLKTSDFFPAAKSRMFPELQKRPTWKSPNGAFSAPRLDMDRLTFIYSEIAAKPTYQGKKHWHKMKFMSKRLRSLVAQQEQTQDVYWALIEAAIPGSDSMQEHAWTQKLKSRNPSCEVAGHNALVKACKGKADMTSSYALQFHQVLVNLCAKEDLGWSSTPSKAVAAAYSACLDDTLDDVVMV